MPLESTRLNPILNLGEVVQRDTLLLGKEKVVVVHHLFLRFLMDGSRVHLFAVDKVGVLMGELRVFAKPPGYFLAGQLLVVAALYLSLQCIPFCPQCVEFWSVPRFTATTGHRLNRIVDRLFPGSEVAQGLVRVALV